MPSFFNSNKKKTYGNLDDDEDGNEILTKVLLPSQIFYIILYIRLTMKNLIGQDHPINSQ